VRTATQPPGSRVRSAEGGRTRGCSTRTGRTVGRVDQLNTLYARGLCSPINYYLELVSKLRDGADLDDLMSQVPTRLLARLQAIAAGHHSSPTPSPDPVEVEISRQVAGWRKTEEDVTNRPNNGRRGTHGPVSRASRARRPARFINDSSAARMVAALFRRISEPSRLSILLILSEADHPVSELAAQLERSQPTVSHHLTLLHDSGLIASARQGRTTLYRLTRKGRKSAAAVNTLIKTRSGPIVPK
jgi:DNA-binding transcriptional ArsR family regulator